MVEEDKETEEKSCAYIRVVILFHHCLVLAVNLVHLRLVAMTAVYEQFL